MSDKFNLALIPKSNGIKQAIIDYANRHAEVADRYLLNAGSLPHVTIHQFSADTSELPNIIERIDTSALIKALTLSFENFSCISFDNTTYWTSLMPDHRDILSSLHLDYAKLLSLPTKPNYDPHMTLFSSLNSDYEKFVAEIKPSYKTISDEFSLSLGDCDSVGQYTKIIHTFT